MRVALVSHTTNYWTALYAHDLLGRGHDVRVLSFSADAIDGVSVDVVGSGATGGLKGIGYLRHVPRLRRLLARYAPDVILAPYLTSNGLVSALARTAPLVVSAHGSDVLVPRMGNGVHRRLLRYVCSRATAVHAVSDQIADTLSECGVDAGKITTFPIGVDVDFFRPDATAHDDGAPLRIVSTRRMEPLYDNGVLIDALALLVADGDRYAATLVGDGSELDGLRRRVAGHNLTDVDLPGAVSSDQVRALLATADIYVSTARSDGTSSALLEAMASGLLPVVSRIPGNEAWLEDGVTGLFFEVGDSAGLAAALRRAGDPDLRASAATINRRRVVELGNRATNMQRMADLLAQAAATR